MLLFILDAPPELEESLIDFLLEYDSEIEFTTFPISAHRRTDSGYTLAEQVTGRKKQQSFHLALQKDRLADLVRALKNEFEGAGLEFRTVAILNRGEI
ncbi:MAG: DUF3240 family protein, partial [Methylococcaceae bacterium]|nr:DUF3240 family protein [Methylococcaceae bacterium]